ncbi:MAG: alpha/beta hydrolase, partial [Dehalococcoidia bacterium]
AVGGDSAGGNLAAVVCQQAKAAGGPAIAFQLLVYPVTDYGFATPSYSQNASGYLLTRDSMDWFWHLYLNGKHEGADPKASPLRAADLSSLPPALVITAEFDPLRDEGEAYGSALQAAGVPAAITRYAGQVHGFFGMAEAMHQSRAAQLHASTALKATLLQPPA